MAEGMAEAIAEAGAEVATSHTGALAGSDEAVDAFLADCGILRVDMLETLFEIAPLVIGRHAPEARRRTVVVMTTTGGGGAMVVDRLALVGIDVPSATDYCHTLAKDAGVVLLPSSFLSYGDKHVRFGFGRAGFAAGLEHYEHYLQTRS